MNTPTNSEQVFRDTVEKILDMEHEVEDIRRDQKEFYAAIKALGYNTADVRKMITRMKKNRQDVLDQDEALYHLERAMGLAMPDW